MKTKAPAVDIVQIPGAFSLDRKDHLQQALLDRPYWTSFKSPPLERLLTAVFEGNRELRQGWLRLDQSRALLAKAQANILPSFSLTASVGKSRSDAGLSTGPSYSSPLSLGSKLSYEVDLFKRLENLENKALTEEMLSEEQVRITALTLAGQSVDTWLLLGKEKYLIETLQWLQSAREQLLKLSKERYAQGLSGLMELQRQQLLLSGLKSDLSQARLRSRVLEQKVNVLLGRAPQEDISSFMGKMPQLPDLPSLGSPIDLIQRRPDLRAQVLKLVGSHYDLQAGLASRFPTLGLAFSHSFSSERLGDIFSTQLSSLLLNSALSVWDGGLRKADIDYKTAILEEQAQALAGQIFEAIHEVESALDQEASLNYRIEEREEEMIVATRLLTSMKKKVQEGQENYQALVEQRYEFTQQQWKLKELHIERLQNRNTLYRSLGWLNMDLLRPVKGEKEEVLDLG